MLCISCVAYMFRVMHAIFSVLPYRDDTCNSHIHTEWYEREILGFQPVEFCLSGRYLVFRCFECSLEVLH